MNTLPQVQPVPSGQAVLEEDKALVYVGVGAAFVGISGLSVYFHKKNEERRAKLTQEERMWEDVRDLAWAAFVW